MLIQANTRRASVAKLPLIDAVSDHIDTARVTSPREESWGKPLTISTDGSTADRSGFMGWGSTPQSLAAVVDDARKVGYSVEHLSIPMWEAGWRGSRPKISKKVEAEMHVFSDRFFGKNLSPEGRIGVAGDSFTWNGRKVQLFGYSTYGVISDQLLDMETYLDWLRHIGCTVTRTFLNDQFTQTRFLSEGRNVPRGLSPWKFKKSFNLLAFNENFFERLFAYVEGCDQRGIVATISLFDRFQLQNKADLPETGWRFSPYNPANNRQKLGDREVRRDGYPKGFLDTKGSLWEAHEALCRKVKETILSTSGKGRNVVIEPLNEGDFGYSAREVKAFHKAVGRIFKKKPEPDLPPIDKDPPVAQPDPPSDPEPPVLIQPPQQEPAMPSMPSMPDVKPPGGEPRGDVSNPEPDGFGKINWKPLVSGESLVWSFFGAIKIEINVQKVFAHFGFELFGGALPIVAGLIRRRAGR